MRKKKKKEEKIEIKSLFRKYTFINNEFCTETIKWNMWKRAKVKTTREQQQQQEPVEEKKSPKKESNLYFFHLFFFLVNSPIHTD